MARRSEWDSMRTKGWSKFIHSLYLFITWPFRKPLYCIAFIILLIAIPFCFGAKFSETFVWYKDKFSIGIDYLANTSMVKGVNEKLSYVSASFDKILPKNIAQSEVKPQRKFVSWNVAEFNKVKYKPRQDVFNKKNTDDTPFFFKKKKSDIVEENEVQEEMIVSDDRLYIIKPDLNLIYEEETPELISNEVTIIDENSLVIDNNYIFLYGIYTNPNEYNVEDAIEYLKNIAEENEIVCKVVARTKNGNIATALCFAGDLLINEEMVKNKLAKNVALNM